MNDLEMAVVAAAGGFYGWPVAPAVWEIDPDAEVLLGSRENYLDGLTIASWVR